MKELIFKNSSYLLTAQFLVKIVSFFYTVFLARVLGVDNFGLFTVALSYFSLISAVADFGISRYLIREIARGGKDISTLISNILILRLTVIAVVFALFSLGMTFLDPNVDRVFLTLIALLSIFPQSVALTIDGVFVAVNRIKLAAFGLIFLSVVTALLGVSLVYVGYGAMGAAASLFFGELLYGFFMWFLLWREKIIFRPTVETKILKEIIVGSLPYGLLGILGLLYFKIDTILLSYMRGSFETGIYSIAYKFLEAIIFVPSAISTALFPILAKLHDSNPDHVKRIYYKGLWVMLFISLPILLGYVLILPVIINFFLPQYIESIFVLQILSLIIPLMFLHTPATVALLSTDKYIKEVIIISFGTLAFNLILNILLIPQFGYLAAAFITVLSEAVSLLSFYLLLKYKVFK